VEDRFGLFGDSANLDARQVYSLRRTYHRLGNRFGRTRWNIIGDVSHGESCFDLFGDGVSVDSR